MTNILVTGSNGQLGNEIRILSKNFSNFNFYFTDVDELDITDLAAIENFMKQNPTHYIINCAAYTAVDKAEEDSAKAALINQLAVHNLAVTAQNFDSKLIQISTDYVFDGRNYRPYKETDQTNPQSVYGFSKAAGEKNIAEEMSSDYMIIRTSWLYSSFGNNFVKTMRKLGKERDELNIIFDQIGTPTYARDLAHAILTIINKVENKTSNFISGIYHYSNEGVASWYDFAKEIMQISQINCKINPIETKDYPTPAKRPFYSVLNKAKIKKNYDIEIPYWKDSLKLCIELLKSE